MSKSGGKPAKKLQKEFEAAVAAQQAARGDEAIAKYRALLAQDPAHAGVLANLASALKQAGQLEKALEFYQRAAALKDAPAAAWFNYGNLLHELKRHAEAERAFRRAIELDARLYQAMTNLARLLNEIKRADEAMALHRQALSIEPRNAVSLRGLAQLCFERRELEESERLYRAALELTPDNLEIKNALGVVIKDLGRTEEALALWREVIAKAPRFASAHNNLGVLLRLQRKPAEALVHLRTALEIDPGDNTTAANCIHALLNLGKTSEAEAMARDILRRNPDSPDGQLMLGFALAYQSRVEEAITAFVESHRLYPDSSMGLSNALFASLYSDRRDAAAVAALHRELAAKIVPASPPRTAWSNSRDPDRRLKIGYLSPDLRVHPVSTFFEPILSHHDRRRFEITCYSTTDAADDVTARLQKQASAWRDCHAWDDARIAAQIEQDGIDILVELAGHSAQNRARVLRSKPAPIQALYIGYPGSSGLPEVDYLIADGRVCPPEHDRHYTERIARLPRSFWCFAPPDTAPAPAEAPAAANGYVTFGSYNALQKLSDATVRLWSRVLAAAPGTRLMLKSLSFADDAVRGVVEKRFAAAGVAADRVITVPPTDKKAFYAEYRHIDIALDPVPYNGGTTTCEALWMGVPVIALHGDMFRGRMSASILEILGLPELAADTPDEYVCIASALAGDVPRIVALHRELRGRMASSAICDGPGMARDLEALYRTMWKNWLDGT